MKPRYIFILLLLLLSAPRALAQTEARIAWQVVRYDITADLGAASGRALNARVTINATNIGGAAGRTLTGRINPAAVVSAVSVAGAPAKFMTRGDGQTKLLLVTTNLPEAVAPGGSVAVTIDYQLPVAENTGVEAVSSEGAQFLPLSY